MKRRSITEQLKNAVRNSFKEGVSKHSEKSQGRNWHDQGKSFSYQTRNCRLDTAENFGKFMRENYPDVKWARDITAEHYNSYLQVGKEMGWSKDTLVTRASNLRAISREVRETYHVVTVNEKDIKTPLQENVAVKRDREVLKTDIENLKKACTNPNLNKGIAFSEAFGARVEGIVKIKPEDVYMKSDGSIYCHLREKGGRDREVKAITPEKGYKCLEIARNGIWGQRIIKIQDASLNRALNRLMNECGMKDRYEHIGFHGLRKSFAQELYNQYREDHTKRETIFYVNEQLGHSAERDSDLLSHYVGNMW